MIKTHPLRAIGLWAAIMAALFLLSASGEPGFWKSGPGWLGAIGWFGFCLPVLAMIGLCVYLAVARRRGR